MSVSISLEGKVAIVTGGGRGIGKAIAKTYAQAGARVVIASRKRENLEATAQEFSDLPGTVVPMACNVGKADDIENLAAETMKLLGAVDILVNNSATNIGQGPSLEATDEMLDKMVDVNVKSALRLVRAIVPGMIERGRGGCVINIVSIAGLRPQYQGLLYSFTKAGLIMMTKSWAQEFAEHNIRVNAIAPGLIKTDFSAYFHENPERVRSVEQTQPMPRIGNAEELGHAALYLASDASSYTTGEVMVARWWLEAVRSSSRVLLLPRAARAFTGLGPSLSAAERSSVLAG